MILPGLWLKKGFTRNKKDKSPVGFKQQGFIFYPSCYMIEFEYALFA